MNRFQQLYSHAFAIRKNVVRMVHAAKSGHPGGSLSAADILTYLYFEEMNISKDNVNSSDRDRFVLSKGHASPLLYAVLHEKGLLSEDLTKFRQIDRKLQGHPNRNYIAGVDMSTGSLGQGISCAVGMAMANTLDSSTNRVYALLGDGECQEGQVWEAIMAAAHYKLDNLCVIVDCNHLQIDGAVEEVMNVYPLDKKFAAFGWNVSKIDGHNFESIAYALHNAKCVKGKPTVILANTIKGKGVSFMENNYAWHGVAPNDEQLAQALAELGE